MKMDNIHNTPYQGDQFFETQGFRVVRALRRITHAIDSYSRRLNKEYNVTSPQMICLYSLVRQGPMTLSALAKEVDLGASTVNGIVDRLEAKGLVHRRRSDTDKRKVFIQITSLGRELTQNAPILLHDRLSSALRSLPELEQAAIALSLERIVDLMMEQRALDSASGNCETGTNKSQKEIPSATD